MISNFSELVALAKKKGPKKIAVANAVDEDVIKTLATATEMGMVECVLTGDKNLIVELSKKNNLRYSEIIDASDEVDAVEKAVRFSKDHSCVLMKGLVPTSTYMRGILNKDWGLRTGKLMSLLAIYELPFYNKLIYCSDSGINVAPDLEAKKQILQALVTAMNNAGYQEPKIALLAASEVHDPKISASNDAVKLLEFTNNQNDFKCKAEGPISFDLAFSEKAALHKQYESEISGDVDGLLFPNIESGNFLGKSWLLFNRAKWAGIVLGARNPVILGSRSDSPEVKINSIALACTV